MPRWQALESGITRGGSEGYEWREISGGRSREAVGRHGRDANLARGDFERLPNDFTGGGVFEGEHAVSFNHQGDCLAKVRPSLFECGALSIRTRQFFDEADISFRHLPKNRSELQVH